MNKINPESPAFPIFLQEGLSHNSHVDAGLSIRAHIAAMAMQGLLASGDFTDTAEHALAGLAVRQGDALIEQLNK